MEINILNIESFHEGYIKIVNKKSFVPVTNVAAIESANESSLIFIVNKSPDNTKKIILDSRAKVIICPYFDELKELDCNKCLILVDNPKLYFAQLINSLIHTNKKESIHPTAVIDPEAQIGQGCCIGPHVYIGKVKIGEGATIHANVCIYDNVNIGNNVTLFSGCSVGEAGYGFVRDKESVPIRFPQLGGVIIEDDVEIGSNSCIARGALKDTIIRKGVKIDNLVHIAHNVEVGEYTYIIASTTIAGSTKIGKRCWIAPSQIINKVTIGDDVTVGYGAVVLSSLASNGTYMGNPAVDIHTYSKKEYHLNKIIKNR